MPEIEINVEVWCSCGNGLCNQTSTGRDRRGNPTLTVTPCDRCLDKARDEGREEAEDE